MRIGWFVAKMVLFLFLLYISLVFNPLRTAILIGMLKGVFVVCNWEGSEVFIGLQYLLECLEGVFVDNNRESLFWLIVNLIYWWSFAWYELSWNSFSHRIFLLGYCAYENVAATLLALSLWGSALLFVNFMFMELQFLFMGVMQRSCNTR
jgi:hypothetical protein